MKITIDLTGGHYADDIGFVLEAYKSLSLLAAEAKAPCMSEDVANIMLVINSVLDGLTQGRQRCGCA